MSELNEVIIDALDDLKGQDMVSLDVRDKTDVTDTMIIVSGTSNRHVKSLADHVVEECKKQLKVRPIGVEGEAQAEWILVDFGDTVLHVMQPQIRALYELEKLWSVAAQSRDEH